VFFVGSDPVQSGLIRSFAKPAGRMTGVYSLSQELTGKRLESLKQIAPRLEKVALFFDPNRPAVGGSVKSARAAARRLGIVLVDREVRSTEELRVSLQALDATAADALLLATDATVQTHASMIIEAGRTKKLPTMFYDRSLVVDGGLASYGVSYYSVGKLAASYIRQILQGAHPADLPVERSERLELVVNARTAREIGITIPQSILLRADEIIQ
jgi:putative ABC transport system substrate-binding protein